MYKIKTIHLDDNECNDIRSEISCHIRDIINYIDYCDAISVIDNKISGAISIKANYIRPDTLGFFITATQSDKKNLNMNSIIHVHRVDYADNFIEVINDDDLRPSRGLYIHNEIYLNQPDTKIVVHTHHEGMLRNSIFPINGTRIVEATRKEVQELVALFDDKQCINIWDHGQYTVGSNLEPVLATLKRNIFCSHLS
jgi:hypothetical protein